MAKTTLDRIQDQLDAYNGTHAPHYLRCGVFLPEYRVVFYATPENNTYTFETPGAALEWIKEWQPDKSK